MQLIDWAADFVFGLSGRSVTEYCDIETAIDDDILVMRDGSLVTMIEIHGSQRIVGVEEHAEIVSSLTERLMSQMSHPGHLLEVCMECDNSKAGAERVMQRQLLSTKAAARKLNLAIDDILEERVRQMADLVADERIVAAFWTRPALLPAADWKKAREEQRRADAGAPFASQAQDYLRAPRVMLDTHKSAVEFLVRELTKCSLSATRIPKHDAIRTIREMIDREFVPGDWSPYLPGDNVPVRGYVPADPNDLSAAMWPPIDDQIFARPPLARGFRHCQIGDRIWAPVFIKIPPKITKPFSDLFDRLRISRIPWRIKFSISSAGLNETSVRSMAAGALGLWGKKNRNVAEAFVRMSELSNSCAITALRISAATWAPLGERHFAVLSERSSKLATALQGWGSCTVSEVPGNPIEGVLCTIPGLMGRSIAPASNPPLPEALKLLPWHRPASPWDIGAVTLRADTKLFPYRAYSSLQDYWTTIIFAPMGAGKSNFMSALNLGLVLDDTNDELPLIRILDIGPSSSGFVSLIEFALPEDDRYKAQYHRLQNTEKFSRNVFDTPLGCRRPPPGQRDFLINFICLLATPTDRGSPYDGVEGMVTAVIDQAYRQWSDDKDASPKPYSENVDPVVDAAVRRLEIKIDRHTTWWEIVDALSQRGETRVAQRAQRFAVPILREIAQLAEADGIRKIYTGVTPTNETMPKYFQRAILDALNRYPILSEHTRFDLGDAPIVSLDLDLVAPKGSSAAAMRQTAVMYTLGLWIATNDFLVGEELIPFFPEAYRDYHAKRIERLTRTKRKLAADEVHRPAQAAPQAMKVIDGLIREGRKWKIATDLASQRHEDFSDDFLSLTSCLFVVKRPATGVEELCRRFGFNDVERYVIERRLLGPQPGIGAPMLARFDTKQGRFAHMLVSTPGPIELWAYDTTQDNRTVRNTLYKETGRPDIVRRALASLYPFPSALPKEIERRTKARAEAQSDHPISVIDEIIAEVRDRIKEMCV